jgi:hypothetical protein
MITRSKATKTYSIAELYKCMNDDKGNYHTYMKLLTQKKQDIIQQKLSVNKSKLSIKNDSL